MKNIVEIKNLQMSFQKKIILNDVSFNLESGKIYGFLGNNGAGKTTTIKNKKILIILVDISLLKIMNYL